MKKCFTRRKSKQSMNAKPRCGTSAAGTSAAASTRSSGPPVQGQPANEPAKKRERIDKLLVAQAVIAQQRASDREAAAERRQARARNREGAAVEAQAPKPTGSDSAMAVSPKQQQQQGELGVESSPQHGSGSSGEMPSGPERKRMTPRRAALEVEGTPGKTLMIGFVRLRRYVLAL